MNKKHLYNASLMALTMAMFPNTFGEAINDNEPSNEEKKARLMKHKDELKESHGMKKFNYGEDRNVWALNKQNANRKAKNKGWL
jgi:hypothetical protein